MSDATNIGMAPAGSICIRKATAADLREDPTRAVLFQTPDGQYVWLGYPMKDEAGLTSSSRTAS